MKNTLIQTHKHTNSQIHKFTKFKQNIKTLDLNTMTPIECMLKLHELKKILENAE